MKDAKLKKTTPTAIPNESKPYWEFFGEDKLGKVPVGGADGYVEWKDYKGGSSDEAIKQFVGNYDATKLGQNYLSFFPDDVNLAGPFFLDKSGDVITLMKSNDWRDGEITNISQNTQTGVITITRHNQASITFQAVGFDKIYPVGSLYFTENGNFDPEYSFGGSWMLLPEGNYIKSCDNVGTIPGIYLPASLPPVYGSAIWERNGRYGTDTYIVDGGFKIIGNYSISGSSAQSGTSCPIVAFDAAWNKNYSNNPYREHGVMGEDGLVDVKHFTTMVWIRVASQQAKLERLQKVAAGFTDNINKLKAEINNIKLDIQALNLKKSSANTDEKKEAINNQMNISSVIVENRQYMLKKEQSKLDIINTQIEKTQLKIKEEQKK